jgi:hypothetical protein
MSFVDRGSPCNELENEPPMAHGAPSWSKAAATRAIVSNSSSAIDVIADRGLA